VDSFNHIESTKRDPRNVGIALRAFVFARYVLERVDSEPERAHSSLKRAGSSHECPRSALARARARAECAGLRLEYPRLRPGCARLSLKRLRSRLECPRSSLERARSRLECARSRLAPADSRSESARLGLKDTFFGVRIPRRRARVYEPDGKFAVFPRKIAVYRSSGERCGAATSRLSPVNRSDAPSTRDTTSACLTCTPRSTHPLPCALTRTES
jgi:hypothetical protein